MPTFIISSPDVPQSLRGPIAVSKSYLPRFWPTIYCDLFKANRKASTLTRILGAIDKLYEFGDSMTPSHDPDVLLTNLDVAALKNLMSGFLTLLRSGARQGSVGIDQLWRVGFDFIYKILKLLGVSTHKASQFHVELSDLKDLYGQLSPAMPARPRHIRALPALLIEDVYDILTPNGRRNPFRSDDNQERNLVIFEMLLRLGLRRGELLALRIDSLHSEYDPTVSKVRFWLNVSADRPEEDPRFIKAYLKTDTSWRPVPVPDSLARVIQRYIDGSRRRQNHPFLLTSNQGLPLSAPAISGIFAAITDALSPEARQTLTLRGAELIRPHDLRHTAVVARLQLYRNAGVGMEESIERLRPYFGWSPSSKMPMHYGRAFFQTQFADIWAETFDDHVAALRTVLGVDQ